MEEENIIVDKVDPVSHLPYTIMHKILLLLDSQDMISQMSVLSKDWFAVTSSYPILKFRYDLHRNTRAKFFKYVDYTTSSFCKQHGDAHTFSIVAPRLEPTQVDILDKCLGLILKRGVQVLEIDIYANLNRPMFRLPDTLLSASSITSLSIHGCELPSSLNVDDVKFKSLTLLSLRRVPLDEGVIKCLIDSCPLLEEIILDYCRGVKSFCVSGLQNLKKVEIYGASSYEIVDIEAPNLSHLLLLDNVEMDDEEMYNVEWGPPIMNLASCQKLTTFCYNGLGVNQFLPNFPFIENLSLYLPSHCDNLKLSIQSLKRLALHSKCDLEKIEIDAPDLIWFEYNCTSSSNPFLKEDPAHPKACLKYHSSNPVDRHWFQICRRFLEKNDIFKVLKLVDHPGYMYRDGLMQMQTLPYELEHVELDASNITDMQYFYIGVEAILLCFRPRSLSFSFVSFSVDFRKERYLFEFAYKKLLQEVDRAQTNIQIVVCYSSGAKQHFKDVKSLLKALPQDLQKQTITFSKLSKKHDNGKH